MQVDVLKISKKEYSLCEKTPSFDFAHLTGLFNVQYVFYPNSTNSLSFQIVECPLPLDHIVFPLGSQSFTIG